MENNPLPAPEAGTPPAKILLVDDQPANLLALEAILADLGQVLVKASSGEEALARLLADDFAVILLDVQMPGLDGFATARLIRGRDRTHSTPIIFLTGHDTLDFPVGQAYALGAVDYLVKPIVPAILRSKVAVFVELYRKSQHILRQEEQLRRAQREQWRVTLASIGDGVIVTDATGRITFLNAVAQNLTGWGPEAAGRFLSEVYQVIDEQSRQRVEGPTFAVLREGTGRHYSCLLRHRDGGQRAVEANSAPIQDETGNLTGAILVFRDVTERKRAEEALRFLAQASTILASSLDYQTTLDRVVQLAVPWLADWALVDMVQPDGSTRLLALTHQDPAKIKLARELLKKFPWDPNASAGVTHVIRTGEPELYPEIPEAVLAAVARNPEHLDALKQLGLKSGMCVPLISGGQTIGALSLMTAESGRRFGAPDLELAEHLARRSAVAVQNAQLYQKAREEEERFVLVTENVRDYAIFMLDSAGRVTSWNAGSERALGYRAEEIIGQSAAKFFTPISEQAQRLEHELRTAIETGRAADDMWLLRKDGSQFWASGVTTALRDGNDLHGFVKILRDLTEHKTLEDELRQQTRELAEANERKDQFLAMLAHELRNPLAPILANLHILRMRGNDPDTVEPARVVMERQVRHLARLVDDLLDVSRVNRGRVKLRMEPLDLAELMRTTAEGHRPLMNQSGLTLEIEVPDAPVWVLGDATRLAQVLNNLLDNAIKFAAGRGTVAVQVTTEPSLQQAIVTVRDEGQGIEPDSLPRLFDPFMQSDRSLERTRGGLGLGLSVARGLIELHGGSIEAASAGPGLGAEFTIRLPLHAAPAVPRKPPESDGRKQPLRILVVEDNRDAADSLRMLLELFGHQVAVAYSGPEGVQTASAYHPDVVLCDIGLPGLNGYGVASELRRNPVTAEVHLIAVTGYGQEEDRQRAREAGFDHHLTKPVDPDDLQPLLSPRRI